MTRSSMLVCCVLLAAPAYARGGGHGGGHGGSRHGGGHSSSRSGGSGTGSSSSSHYVTGHATKNGTYVKPHHQTNPDHTQRNNYSTKGNTNPWTGKKGTKNTTH